MTSEPTQKIAHHDSHVKKQTRIIIILSMQAVVKNGVDKNSYFK